MVARVVFHFLVGIYLSSWAFNEIEILCPEIAASISEFYSTTQLPTHDKILYIEDFSERSEIYYDLVAPEDEEVYVAWGEA